MINKETFYCKITRAAKSSFINIPGEDTLTPDVNLREKYGADDLDIISFIMAIEDEFDISLDETSDIKVIESIIYVRDLLPYINKKLEGTGIILG